jgi:hypothetical protein
MLAERMWLVTQRLVCVRLPEKALSNVWWPVSFEGSEDAEKALALWMNSTLGILTLLAHRTPTRGPWVQFKKPALGGLPVLSVNALTPRQLTQLGGAYDTLVRDELGSLRDLAEDPVRASIDEALSRVLGITGVASLRELLGREPIITGDTSGTQMTPVDEEQMVFELL